MKRTLAGLEAARRQDRFGGRERLMTDKKLNAAKELLGSGTPTQEVAQTLGIRADPLAPSASEPAHRSGLQICSSERDFPGTSSLH